MGRAMLFVWILGMTLASGCAGQSPAARPAQSSSILISSSPAAGSTVSEPENLELHFNPPARLDEVTVSGPLGTMPMMVHASGDQAHYSLPLSGMTQGAYSVSWRATAAGREDRGSFQFTVR